MTTPERATAVDATIYSAADTAAAATVARAAVMVPMLPCGDCGSGSDGFR